MTIEIIFFLFFFCFLYFTQFILFLCTKWNLIFILETAPRFRQTDAAGGHEAPSDPWEEPAWSLLGKNTPQKTVRTKLHRPHSARTAERQLVRVMFHPAAFAGCTQPSLLSSNLAGKK
ncbi:MAG: hypothetical protein LBQ15_01735 [Clostridium sp.]|jgi:hypothetical protein|nr:hypothetical protein [Clostridium sp.]